MEWKKKSEKFLNVRVFIFRWNESCNNALLLRKNDVHRKRFYDFSLCVIKRKSLFCGYFLWKNCGFADALYKILDRIFSKNEQMLFSWNYNIYSNSLSFILASMIFFFIRFPPFYFRQAVTKHYWLVSFKSLFTFTYYILVSNCFVPILKKCKHVRKYNLGVNYSVVLILKRCERTFFELNQIIKFTFKCGFYV